MVEADAYQRLITVDRMDHPSECATQYGQRCAQFVEEMSAISGDERGVDRTRKRGINPVDVVDGVRDEPRAQIAKTGQKSSPSDLDDLHVDPAREYPRVSRLVEAVLVSPPQQQPFALGQ
ncbi:hypothetical protein [Umezawaea tangerina]|uniref:hypothetical protein n=1 Tax=Umezawaea tangerina TaxID=84725 RepID=UPI001B802309|nr:hypothetical protein [Umezawaea tangerina]